MFSPASARTLRLVAAIATVGWAVVLALGLVDPISVALLFGIGACVPVALTLLSAGPKSPLEPALPILVPVTTAAGATSLALGVGPAGGVAACLWVVGALVLSFVGVGRGLAALRRKEGRFAELGAALALVSLPVGATWLVMSRLGVDPMSVSSIIVLCTAVHFHFTSFCLVVLTLRAYERAPRGKSVFLAALGGILVAIPLVAAGWSGVPVVIHVGVWLLAIAVGGYALATLVLVVPKLRSVPARVLLGISCLAPLGSMPLAVMYVQAGVDIDTMVAVHGALNAYGLVGLGLLAHLVEERA